MVNGVITAVKPNTRPILAMFEPIILPKAISGDPFRAACKLTSNSGAEVANETTVIPITSLDNLNLNDKATEDRTKNSPPITSSNNPKTTQIILPNRIIFLRR